MLASGRLGNELDQGDGHPHDCLDGYEPLAVCRGRLPVSFKSRLNKATYAAHSGHNADGGDHGTRPGLPRNPPAICPGRRQYFVRYHKANAAHSSTEFLSGQRYAALMSITPQRNLMPGCRMPRSRLSSRIDRPTRVCASRRRSPAAGAAKSSACVFPCQPNIGRYWPRLHSIALCTLTGMLLAPACLGQSAPGGQGGTVPPPSVFRVGGGGFGARNEAQKGRIRAAVFRARGLYTIKERLADFGPIR